MCPNCVTAEDAAKFSEERNDEPYLNTVFREGRGVVAGGWRGSAQLCPSYSIMSHPVLTWKCVSKGDDGYTWHEMGR